VLVFSFSTWKKSCENKIAGFEFPFFGCKEKVFDDEIKGMQEQSTELEIDIDNLEAEINKILKGHDSLLKPTRIIAILRDNIWNVTVMDNMLGILRIKVNAKTAEELSFDKGSLMDFMGIKKP